jgi:hypothetical protein
VRQRPTLDLAWRDMIFAREFSGGEAC